MITVLLFSLSGLDYLFAQIAEDATLLGLVLRYLRYFLLSIFDLQ